jgi:hypothetical protein
MLPFSVDRLLIAMSNDFDLVKKDIVSYKFNFCNEFEKELNLEVGEYSQLVFDYIFNLYNFRQAFGRDEFRSLIEDVKDMNFSNHSTISDYVSLKYKSFLTIYQKYFMDYFGFKHADPLYMSRKIEGNREEIRGKILTYGT